MLIYDLTTHLYLVDLATGTGRALPTVDWTSPYGQPLRLLAWSPDGRFVAYAVPSNCETSTSPASDLARADNILGWSSDSTLLARDYIDDHDAITEVSLVDGSRRTVSTFDNSHSCEYFTQTCGVYRLRLAQGLIRPVASRAPDPDRGPWLPIWRAFLALAVAAATVAVLRPSSPPRLPHLRASLGLTGQNVKFSRPIHR